MMANKRPEYGRGLFYSRDSGGRHEMTPGKYIEWAQKQAQQLQVSFDGTLKVIEQMMCDGTAHVGDIFFDYGVQGHKTSRPALDAMRAEMHADNNVSHIFIPRRDRLSRPSDPLDGVRLESEFTKAGVTLVYESNTVKPGTKGKRPDLGELLTAIVDYDKSGGDRRDLARKVILAQMRLAELGFSTGGGPPYGFRRWLATGIGKPVRELAEGERVRMKGHHVVWLPYEPQLVVVRRILNLLKTTSATEVARLLDVEAIPSPHAGRYRTDNGVRHKVSGNWNVSTINDIARRPLLLAITAYGQRSMGDQLRLSTNGPRELDADDYRADDQPKVIRNPESIQVRGQAKFEPLVDLNDHKQLLAELDRRAGSQRGKIRSKDRSRNPLGGRIFDMDCGWPMYRNPHNGSFRYKCGLYGQSHGRRCNHNTIDGPAAATFALNCIRQRLLQPHVWDKLERRLRELASTESDDRNCPEEIKMLNQRQLEVDADLETAKKNLALARTAAQFNAISSVFDDLQREKEQLEKKIQKMERKSCRNGNVDAETEKALENARRLCHYASCDTDNLEITRRIIEVANVRLFTRFRRTKPGKRTLNKLAGGVVTFGAAEPPVQLYDGPTDRKYIKSDRKMRAEKNRQHKPALQKTVVSRGGNRSRVGQ